MQKSRLMLDWPTSACSSTEPPSNCSSPGSQASATTQPERKASENCAQSPCVTQTACGNDNNNRDVQGSALEETARFPVLLGSTFCFSRSEIKVVSDSEPAAEPVLEMDIQVVRTPLLLRRPSFPASRLQVTTIEVVRTALLLRRPSFPASRLQVDSLRPDRVADPFQRFGHDVHGHIEHGGYRRLNALGQGTTSTVYRAVRLADNRAVALKVIKRCDPEMAEVARREYELLLGLTHPNIIKVIDFLASPNQCSTLVLEYFEGQSLQKVVQLAGARRFSYSDALPLFAQLLEVVRYLHESGVVHRDIKADNILVSTDLGRLMLIDFNTARYDRENSAMTMTGTKEYAAPEVLCGEPPSESSDVWNAGLCFHLMLVGRLPLRDSEGAWADIVVDIPAILPAQGLGTTRALCKALLLRSLADDKRLRPSASELLALVDEDSSVQSSRSEM
ncbi:unnamed protein product [Polarella glacialis]|uniref:Protein kinase domain-containing protein n=1 Tax=Polarella glacialis TaxID=89957 RepID=A0A813LBF3_POLGL|nr:unnamed protein product [Polarella glacialis]